jgi:hypothetical protein
MLTHPLHKAQSKAGKYAVIHGLRFFLDFRGLSNLGSADCACARPGAISTTVCANVDTPFGSGGMAGFSLLDAAMHVEQQIVQIARSGLLMLFDQKSQFA